MSAGFSEAEVAAAHDLLRQHYGESVLPIHEVCNGIEKWLATIHVEHLQNEDDHALHRLAQAVELVGPGMTITASKSNLLYRLLYLRQPLRTKKCPEHDGHWAGCPMPGAECPHGCTFAGNTTGWLP